MWTSWLSRSQAARRPAAGRLLAPGEADIVRTGGDEDLAGHARIDERLRLVHVLDLDLVILGAADLREYTSSPSIVMMNVSGVSLPSTPA